VYLKQLTVAYYLQPLVGHPLPLQSGPALLLQAFQETGGVGISVIALLVITAGGLWLAGRTVERREYVLEP
jgi:hypothetical protein